MSGAPKLPDRKAFRWAVVAWNVGKNLGMADKLLSFNPAISAFLSLKRTFRETLFFYHPYIPSFHFQSYDSSILNDSASSPTVRSFFSVIWTALTLYSRLYLLIWFIFCSCPTWGSWAYILTKHTLDLSGAGHFRMEDHFFYITLVLGPTECFI